MKTLYYTEQNLENAVSMDIDYADMQGGRAINGVDYNRIQTIPGPWGARTFPAEGAFSTPEMINMSDAGTGKKDGDKSPGDEKMTLIVIAAAIAAAYFLIPR